MGGTLESFHFALGSDGWHVIVELPDHAAAAAIALITSERIDAVVERMPDFRPPGT